MKKTAVEKYHFRNFKDGSGWEKLLLMALNIKGMESRGTSIMLI